MCVCVRASACVCVCGHAWDRGGGCRVEGRRRLLGKRDSPHGLQWCTHTHTPTHTLIEITAFL